MINKNLEANISSESFNIKGNKIEITELLSRILSITVIAMIISSSFYVPVVSAYSDRDITISSLSDTMPVADFT